MTGKRSSELPTRVWVIVAALTAMGACERSIQPSEAVSPPTARVGAPSTGDDHATGDDRATGETQAQGDASTYRPASSKRRRRHSEGRAKDEATPTPQKRSAYASAMIAGDSALYSGRFDTARLEFLRAMEERPGKTAPALGALRALREKGRGEERAGVIRTIRKKLDALRAQPETIGAAHLLSARMAIALGQPGEAMDSATMAVELLPTLGVAWRVRGEAAMVAEDWSGAVHSLRRAAELGLQAKAGTWERMADALDELGQLEDAEAAARRAVDLTGSDPNAQRKRLNLLAVVLKRRSKLDEASETVKVALALGRDDPMVLHNAATIAEARGATEVALSTYSKSLQAAPLPMTHWRRGRLLLLNDRPNDALLHFKAAAAHPTRWTWPASTIHWPAYDVAKLYARAGRHEVALGWFQDASRLALLPSDQQDIRSWIRYTRAEQRRMNKARP